MPFLGEIRLFAFNFVPEGWLACNGQSLNVQENQALYSLIGNFYGGDNKAFNLPDLRGRVAVGAGTGTGLSSVPFAGMGGAEKVTLNITQMPTHLHQFTEGTVFMPVSTQPGDTNDPTKGVPAPIVINVDDPNGFVTATANAFRTGGGDTTQPLNLKGAVSSVSGGGQPFNHRDPFLGLQYCICTENADYPVKRE